MDIQRWDRAKEKVGNTFELTVLIQKRVREIVRDRQKPLVDFEHRNPIQIALEEILQDKIYLAPPPALEEEEVESTDVVEMPPLMGSPTEELAPIDPTAPPMPPSAPAPQRDSLDNEDITDNMNNEPQQRVSALD
jgi:DNA-directed RNA polymerase omega subunit